MPERRDLHKDAQNLNKAKGGRPMINIYEVNETNKMIEQENLDVRTITMGISL